ncbi:hypothetical protein [Sphingomonas prati]|uniref:Uncharacterized protein n=1 Tax=Sphingomonas prati TaxID=1843237 RepID=A0A7W9BSP2_9SPHN|nr:hypothetical protein [Sphingomonas prati]MBB5729219.1 hypothetical protein [Sphingomonas prati]GGE84215.1 hypothetical protein GCM10011404_16120 [Sphingomonas prati]
MTNMINIWEAIKAVIVPSGAAERSLIHVHGGMMVFVFAVLCVPGRLRSVWPPVIVTLLVLVNELFDLSHHWPMVPAWLWRDSGKDVLHTIVWPWVIWIVATQSGRRAA